MFSCFTSLHLRIVFCHSSRLSHLVTLPPLRDKSVLTPVYVGSKEVVPPSLSSIFWQIISLDQQRILVREKRDYYSHDHQYLATGRHRRDNNPAADTTHSSIYLNDELWPEQWYLVSLCLLFVK